MFYALQVLITQVLIKGVICLKGEAGDVSRVQGPRQGATKQASLSLKKQS